MSCSIDHLNKVVSEGFSLTDELYSQKLTEKAHRRAPISKYVYHGPQAVTVVQQPVTGSYHQIQTTQNNERWYVCQVSQGPVYQ
ncbi:hypothetical protein V6N13_091373 [Hibiscus sabdariffa]|uniref:Uncharacterized protein n=2 Tax=Hibiscus sabdariffa TaxID=183260 RepID=A0ABR2A3U4_9ROSI